MKIKTRDNINLYFETFGDKKETPIVLLHGLGADHDMWKPQIEKYPSKELFVITPDMRGHGETSNVDTFKIKDCAHDIKELLDHLDIKKAHIVSVSMGGLIAQQFACDFQSYIYTLIIADSFSEVSSFSEKITGWMQWLTIKIAPGLLRRSLASAYKGPDKKMALTYFQKSFAQIDKNQLLSARAEINRFNITPYLNQITVPSLVLVGDGFGDFAIRMAKNTSKFIKNSTFKILKGGCDPSNLVVPDLFDKCVIDFINNYE